MTHPIPPGGSEGRLPVVDLVRFASIIMVVGGHFSPAWVAGTTSFTEAGTQALGLFLNGAYGVSFFS